MLARNRLAATTAVRSKSATLWSVVVLAIPFLLMGAQRAHAQVACVASCDNGAGGTGTRDTPGLCLTDFCRNPITCGCGSLTVCTADGVSVLPPPVCGDGEREGTEECDPGFNAFGEEDCNCPGECQADCACPTPVACVASCDNGAGGTGTRDTPGLCLTDFCRNPITCGCGSLTVCTADGVSVLPPPVCGDGEREGTEECDPGFNAFGEEDCNCPGECQADCTCPGPGAVCGNNVREGSEQCDGTDDAACPGLCQADCTCSGEAVPTVSEWGMVILMLSLLVGFKLKFGHHPAPEAR